MNSQSPPTTGKGIAPCYLPNSGCPEFYAAPTHSPFNSAAVFTKRGSYGALDSTAPGMSPEESLRRARIFAASPELLEACKVARQWLIDAFSTLSNSEHALLDVPAYRQLCAAIAKAEVTK